MINGNLITDKLLSEASIVSSLHTFKLFNWMLAEVIVKYVRSRVYRLDPTKLEYSAEWGDSFSTPMPGDAPNSRFFECQ
jgi:hypothetical protein